MSQKIDDVLEVLERVRQEVRSSARKSARDARIRAVRAIAKARGVTYQTIGDAYLRRLKPDIDGTTAFDMVMQAWLDGHPDSLKKVLFNQALDSADHLSIGRFFTRPN
jgi:hypothetical protein